MVHNCPSQYSELSLEQLIKFIMLASKLKHNIILVQPTSIPASHPPNILPPLITPFLQNSCGISETCVTSWWDTLKSIIWYESHWFTDTSESDFAEHGSLCVVGNLDDIQSTYFILGLDTLYPPHLTCMNSSCSWRWTGRLLKQVEQRQGVMYTFARGAQPIHLVHLYCERECLVNINKIQ